MMKNTHQQNAAVLLEVILSLSLFAIAATTLVGAISMSFDSVQRLTLQPRAADLTHSLFTELRLGMRDMNSVENEMFVTERLEDWRYSITVEEELVEQTDPPLTLRRVTINVNHLYESGVSYTQTQWIADEIDLQDIQNFQDQMQEVQTP